MNRSNKEELRKTLISHLDDRYDYLLKRAIYYKNLIDEVELFDITLARIKRYEDELKWRKD